MPILLELKSSLKTSKNKIIKKINEPTEWVNSLVIVRKSNGTLRLCLDLCHLNAAVKREYFVLPTTDEIVSKLSGAKVFSTLDANGGFWQIALDEESAKKMYFLNSLWQILLFTSTLWYQLSTRSISQKI